MVIWKFTLPETFNDVVMPYESKILHAGIQKGQIHLWAVVDPTQPTTTRHFFIADTGKTLRHNVFADNHIGTVISSDESLAFHVFEIKDLEKV